ncbi:phosphoserine phosphatase SerB [Streptococcus iniae]|uniref:phosphoserine phosphatase SerB n=1 Tax=Streptococcus iniae TaxID=1346 RepID=UPI002B2BE83F|nr:phosphoserine phosphatase SerB [Streptococcus iniae]WNZ95456.1 phosphoserine phosphatase SerB [Streptococcus iniae]WNZ98089.1 phosphoserine phosphatase SerB [Streptococcus iniae]
MDKIKGLLVMDVDSTLVQEEVIDLLGQVAGLGREIAKITELAMKGHLDFEEALKERVSLLSGLSAEVFDSIYPMIHFQKGAKELVATLHERHYKIGLVSGGFHETVDRLVAELGIDYVMANRLQVRDDTLTGKLEGPIVTKEVKCDKLKEWADLNGLDLSQTIAVGDGANDLMMIKEAGIGIAFCAKELVKQEATYRIDIPDLREVLAIISQHERANK